MSVAEAASKFLCGEQADVVREAVRTVVAELMELEIAELTGAARSERSPERAGLVAVVVGLPRRRRESVRGGETGLKARIGGFGLSKLEK
jgi:transposase-like protein